MKLILCLPLILGGCAAINETAHLDAQAPVGVYHSAKARSEVADCLLNRLSGSGMRPEQQISSGETMLRFTSTDQWTSPGLYLFTINDEGSGSVVEARMPHGFVKRGLPTAETCF
jgi:hypothetical protein